MADAFDELDKILDAGDAAEAERTRQYQAEDEARAAWAEEFRAWLDDFATPVLEPFAGKLRERGIEVQFVTDTLRGHREPNPKPRELEMRIGGDFGKRASVKLTRHDDRIVGIERSAGGGGVIDRSKAIDMVTAEMLQEAVLDAVRERFGN